MKVVIGNEDEQLIQQTAEAYEKKVSERLTSGEEFFRQDQFKVMGLKDLNAPLPNGMKVVVVKEGKKDLVYVTSKAGKKRCYEVNTQTGIIRLNKRECSREELEDLMRIMGYMQANCNERNSQTVTLSLNKER